MILLQLLKIMDSAIDIFNHSMTSPVHLPLSNSLQSTNTNTTPPLINTVIHLPSNNVSMATNQMHVSNIQHTVISPHDNQNVPKCITTLNSLPVTIPERKYEISSQYYQTFKKKRKIEEANCYRSPAIDKRPIFENVPNEHVLVPDNYSAFECNLSWQTPAVSAGATQAGKWWA